MPLASGVRLGVYEVLSPLGAGEVYKARDTGPAVRRVSKARPGRRRLSTIDARRSTGTVD